MTKARIWIGVLIGLAASLSEANAQSGSPMCLDLQSQYAALLRQGGGNSGQRMVDMDKISRELSNAQAAARQGNCGRFLFFGPRPAPQCPAITAAIGRLQRQLAQARGQRGFGGGVGGGFRTFAQDPDMEKARLRDWMNQYGCDVPSLGGYRTICVRVCDGYYFPISFSASRQRIAQDAEVCQSMYSQAGQAEIFAHNSGRDVADAVSPGGLRYGDQPFAFLYRQSFNPYCATELKDGIAALGQRYFTALTERGGSLQAKLLVVAGATPEPAGAPMPNYRPAERGEDPETIALRAGIFPAAPYVPADQRPETVMAGGIRQVGDAYYAELFDPTGAPIAPPAHRPALGFDLIGQALAMQREARPETTQPLPQ